MKQEIFLERMQYYLKDEYETYVATLQEPAFRGLRVNTSKATIEEVLQMNLCEVEASSICPQSFYICDTSIKLGKHPAHLAGLFYLQEPSASSAVEVLDVKEGDWVLDLCAAPGGKSTQIAAKLQHTGFLLSNEIESKRAHILVSNMERLGFSECMITNAHPDALCKETSGWFDKVLVDAPCSGEGMFKKHDAAMQDWSVEHIEACARRQMNILESAYIALKQNGILVYSTCTYSMEENEQVVYDFLQQHPDMELLDTNVSFGRIGFPYRDLDISNVRRIFPMDKGEGHFIAKLKKTGEAITSRKQEITSSVDKEALAFIKQQLKHSGSYTLQLQNKVYVKQTPFLKLKNIHILRQGVLCGEMTKGRLEPHLHFYLAGIHQASFLQTYDMSEEECQSYIRGNQLFVSGYKGYTTLTWHGYPIAFAKGDGTVLKNKYPKGLRLKG